MIVNVDELLPLYVLGLLDPDDALVVERAVAGDPSLATALASYRDAAVLLVAPSEAEDDGLARVKLRLMASAGAGRFESFSSRMASLFDVSVDRARELLGLIERPGSWEPQIPGIELVHFEGGPTYAAADCGFVRLAPGAMFPPHTHMGEEVTVILSGRVRDAATGALRGPGDELIQAPGSEHSFVCIDDEVCLYAARAINGIEIAGAPVRPLKRS